MVRNEGHDSHKALTSTVSNTLNRDKAPSFCPSTEADKAIKYDDNAEKSMKK